MESLIGDEGAFIRGWCKPLSVCVASLCTSPLVSLHMSLLFIGHVQAIVLSQEARDLSPCTGGQNELKTSLNPNSNHSKRGHGYLDIASVMISDFTESENKVKTSG